MWINHVSLNNFRNYTEVQLDLNPKINLFVGQNAQGKSNFLESVELMSLGKSTRSANDMDLIMHNKTGLIIEAEFQDEPWAKNIKISFTKQSNEKIAKSFIVNSFEHKTRKSVLGHLLCVSFKSQDLNLTQSSPKYRRDWLDNIACLISIPYLETLINLDKLLKQKNALLRNFNHGIKASFNDNLDIYNQQISLVGAKIIKFRLKTLSRIHEYAKANLLDISNNADDLDVNYLLTSNSAKNTYNELLQIPQEDIAQLLMNDLTSIRPLEILRKQSLIGPQRHDIDFMVNAKSAKGFASQGQQRSLVLALKLAELQLLEDKFNQKPVLLLDDVLAELDNQRQEQLLRKISLGSQAIITTVSVDYLPPYLFKNANIFNVVGGQIQKS